MSDNMTFIPIIVPQSPSTCPSCGNIESTKTTCRHCDYEYKNGDITFLGVLGFIVGLIVFFWAAATVLIWVGSYQPTTLVEVLAGQWKWFTSLRVW